ncbi:response regulator transcription factor [Maribellus sediminis]|uniref:response regulator transcription factor n=1 Tax=Maribellus sediminis TaxID=2696285 RepID=UPI0023F6F101|nr:helix-turn-helix transcriptional regulator [Maribellus sediminis]
MAKSIVIIHPAEIIRKGISSLLEDFQSVRISCFPDFSKLNMQELKAAQKLLLIVPANCRYAQELLELRTSIGEHELVGVLTNDKEKCEDNAFDHLIPIDVPAKQLIQIAEGFFESDDTDNSGELTIREKEVLRLIALGNTNKTIADTLFISTHTVISHRKNITEKLGIKSIPGLTVYAIIQKIVGPSDISPDQLS